MAVLIGSARIDENGHARGGKAGDQTGREVSTQNWYNHSGGWRVFRPKDPAVAEKIAWDMQAACNNNNIGYDQGQRSNLYSISKPLGFDCAKVNVKTETDCSALVRVCCAYAGVMLPDFNTASEASALLKSGAFTELTGAKYTASPDYERRGDILVTRKKGHTAVVLTNGPKAEPLPAQAYRLGDRTLERGMSGPDVKELQDDLSKLGYEFPGYGCDGDFGEETERNVRGFQRVSGLEADGIFGPKSCEALKNALYRYVEITTNALNVRKGPGLNYAVLGVVKMGERLPYGGEAREDGARTWLLVEYQGANGWVSAKYAKLVE